mmetsp:Transcript_33749/g.86548  ORF Transcript_33749/g.86548 Transcript_33749/m.86548 type:complete len:253 (-) Transcript_33749:55-813(-)
MASFRILSFFSIAFLLSSSVLSSPDPLPPPPPLSSPPPNPLPAYPLFLVKVFTPNDSDVRAFANSPYWMSPFPSLSMYPTSASISASDSCMWYLRIPLLNSSTVMLPSPSLSKKRNMLRNFSALCTALDMSICRPSSVSTRAGPLEVGERSEREGGREGEFPLFSPFSPPPPSPTSPSAGRGGVEEWDCPVPSTPSPPPFILSPAFSPIFAHACLCPAVAVRVASSILLSDGSCPVQFRMKRLADTSFCSAC